MQCLFQYRVEYRREVAGRGIDDLQYLRGRGLLLQRLARLVNEPRVLHRNDRLIGEGLHKRDLLDGEGPNFLTVDGDCAKQSVVFAQRHCHSTSHAADVYHLPEPERGTIARVIRRIAEVDNLLAIYNSTQRGTITVWPE